MRIYSFFLASALAATVTFVASGERGRPEPSGSEMKSTFSQFFSKLETKSIPESRFTAFEKHACKWSNTLSGHICSFTYSTDLHVERLSVLPAHGTLSGTFFLDDEGRLKFETVIG